MRQVVVNGILVAGIGKLAHEKVSACLQVVGCIGS